MELLIALLGLVILLAGGDLLVRGAVAVSLQLGVPALVVGLTVVAFGTSAPELLVSVQSALVGAPGIALGNVVGSNIANVLLVLGVPALISRMDTRAHDTRESYLMMMGASLVFAVLLFLSPLGRGHGAVLLAILAATLARMAWTARGDASAVLDEVDPETARAMPAWRAGLYIAVGIVALPAGADLLVDAARAFALDFGIAEEVVGLTLVAVGTSLPELATTVMAAVRRQGDVAMGNVIGSNLLNLVAIIGVTTMIAPLEVSPQMLRQDLWVMLGASLILAPFAMGAMRLGRRVGVGFLLLYAGYVAILF